MVPSTEVTAPPKKERYVGSVTHLRASFFSLLLHARPSCRPILCTRALTHGAPYVDVSPRCRGHFWHLRVSSSTDAEPEIVTFADGDLALPDRYPLPAGVSSRPPIDFAFAAYMMLIAVYSCRFLATDYSKFPTWQRRCPLDPVHHCLAAGRCL